MRDSTHTDDDAGFGLVEVMVAMALLVIVALSMLPVMVMALRASSTNISVTTASQLASDQMDWTRALDPTCLAMQGFVASTVGIYESDPRGTELLIDNQLTSACPTTYPGTVSLRSTIKVRDTGQVLATTESLIFLSKAS